MLQYSTIQLLRFHFSFFLLPVYLFAISQVPHLKPAAALAVFFILHLLVYPSSNGYNSYIDRDESPIGGLKVPLRPTRQLFNVTLVMDVIAVVVSCFLSFLLAASILVYIIASRAYSGPPVRLKRFPVIGFLVVFFCQGALIYFLTYRSVSGGDSVSMLPMLISSCLIGALYPLTQVYQHAEDKAAGIKTLSMVLGVRGTFLFSMGLFSLATGLLTLFFHQTFQLNHLYLFLLITIPVLVFFFTWMARVWHDESKADFKHSLAMNVIATACTSSYFLTLFILNQ